MADRTLKAIESDKEKINDAHEKLGVKLGNARSVVSDLEKQQNKLDEDWNKLDEEWFDVRHSGWNQALITEAQSLNLNLKSYSTEAQLKEAIDQLVKAS